MSVPEGEPDPRLEPYLFDGPTVARLLELARPFPSLLLLGCPSLARALQASGDPRPRLLVDLDGRHAVLGPFLRADFAALAELPADYALALFDPPALRLPPDAVAALLARLHPPPAELLLAYPEPLFPRLAAALPGAALRPLPHPPRYERKNPFNERAYRLYATPGVA